MALQEKKIMPPPWLAHREIERYSIGWRMGYGEDYIYRFGDWLDTLSPDERTEYRTLFPEPVTWKGWWDDEDSSEVLEHGDFWVNAWQPEGSPKYTRQWLQQEFSMGRKRELCLFWGHQPAEDGQLTKSCLSQWWMEDFWSIANTYLCMEQYMMAAKAELFGDSEIQEQILKCSDPKQIKALGRKVRGFDQKVWDKFKYAIVLNGNWCKFSQNRDLREFLLSTGDSVLVEASPYDNIWGIRLAASSPEAQDPMKWRGQNLLGFALMEVRDELRRVTQNEMLCDWFAKRMTWELDNEEGLSCLFFELEDGYFTLSRKTGAEALRLEMNDPANGQLIDPDCFEYALDPTSFRLNIVRNNRKVLRYLEEHHINTELYGEIVLHYTPLSKPQLESLSAVTLRLFFGELLF